MTTLTVPLVNIGLAAQQPDVVRSCIVLQPSPPPDPGEEPPAPVGDNDIYTPVAPGVTYAALPTAPTIVDTSPDQMIGCIITVADNPQGRLNALFPSAISGDGVIDRATNDIWVYDGATWNNVGPTPGPTIVATVVIPPWNEIVSADAITRTKLDITSLGYALTLLTEPDPVITQTTLLARNVPAYIAVPSTDFTFTVHTPAVASGASALVPLTTTTLAASSVSVSSGGSATVPLTNINITAFDPAYAGKEATVIQGVPVYDTQLAALAPSISTGVSVLPSALDLQLAAPTPVINPFVRVGTAAPLLGAAAATSTTGWTQIVSTNVDDGSIQTASFGFTFTLNSTGYTTCYVGSNGYITFGAGSSEYQNLSASNPAQNKIMFVPGDRSYQKVFTIAGTVRSTSYFGIRWEGAAGTSGPSSTFVELYLYAERDSTQHVQVRYGNSGVTSPSLFIANTSTAYATDTASANTSWVFEGNATGTSWSLTSNRFIPF